MSKQNTNRTTYASTVTCWIDYRRSWTNNSHNRTRATHTNTDKNVHNNSNNNNIHNE